jgi:hypothetical protein
MKVMIEMTDVEVAQRILNDRGMMAVDRSLMERLQHAHPDWMVYRADDDSYHPQSILERVKVR